MTTPDAPRVRRVDQFTGTIAEASAAINKLTDERDAFEAKYEALLADYVRLQTRVQALEQW